MAVSGDIADILPKILELGLGDNWYYHLRIIACFGRETGLGWGISAIRNPPHARHLRAVPADPRRPAALRRRRPASSTHRGHRLLRDGEPAIRRSRDCASKQ